MKTFIYGIKLGAGLVAGKVLITAVAYAALRAMVGRDGLDYILGKGPKPDCLKKEDEE